MNRMGEFGAGRGKWVCPTDRELSLRAKLKTGWSVKTSTINSFTKPEQLTEAEQQAIMNVIKRAEHLEKIEQERVGRLVERLDNMKKNAMGNGTTQCILCADEFGLLGASPLLCCDCRKAVCTKCGVDTFSANKEPLWLCKICAETRETWKKSGAWFYRGLPKYILPEKKNENPSKYGSGSIMNRTPVGSPVPTYNAWLQSKGRSSSDKEYTDSSDEEIRSTRLIRRQTSRQQSSETTLDVGMNSLAPPPVMQQLPSPKVPHRSPSPNFREHSFSLERENSGESGTPERSPPFRKSPEQDANRSPAKTDFPAGRGNSYWYRPRKNTEEEEDDEDIAANELPDKRFQGHSRKESLSMQGSRIQGKNQSPAAVAPQQRTPYEKSSFALPEKRPPSLEEATSPETASTVEFSMLYDPRNQALHCTIYRAKGLKPTDYDGLADPYVQLQLMPVQDKAESKRTRTVHKTLNPEFNETVSFYGVNEYDMAKRTLRLTVLDDDEPYGSDFLGESRVPLKKLRPHQPKEFHIYLERSVRVEESDVDTSQGQILLSLMYSSDHHALIVGIHRCINLPPRDSATVGFCDPYVKIHLKPDQLRRRYKTATKKKTLNPDFNEEFAFEVKPYEMSKKTLAVTVWNRDYTKADDYIGGLTLGVQSKGDRLCHWLDAVRNPNARVERWHSLSSAMID